MKRKCKSKQKDRRMKKPMASKDQRMKHPLSWDDLLADWDTILWKAYSNDSNGNKYIRNNVDKHYFENKQDEFDVDLYVKDMFDTNRHHMLTFLLDEDLQKPWMQQLQDLIYRYQSFYPRKQYLCLYESMNDNKHAEEQKETHIEKYLLNDLVVREIASYMDRSLYDMS